MAQTLLVAVGSLGQIPRRLFNKSYSVVAGMLSSTVFLSIFNLFLRLMGDSSFMEVHIDQSIKIEQTNRDTIIGVSNHVSFTIALKGSVKKLLQKDFRKFGEPRSFVLRTFSAAVVVALLHGKFGEHQQVAIDKEYDGHEDMLLKLMTIMWKASTNHTFPAIHFLNIGKGSPAHKVAYLTSRKKRPVDYFVRHAELRRLVFLQQKRT